MTFSQYCYIIVDVMDNEDKSVEERIKELNEQRKQECAEIMAREDEYFVGAAPRIRKRRIIALAVPFAVGIVAVIIGIVFFVFIEIYKDSVGDTTAAWGEVMSSLFIVIGVAAAIGGTIVLRNLHEDRAEIRKQRKIKQAGLEAYLEQRKVDIEEVNRAYDEKIEELKKKK